MRSADPFRLRSAQFDKITSRIDRLCEGLDRDYVDPVVISQKVVQGVYKGVTTSELDDLASQTAACVGLNLCGSLGRLRGAAGTPFPTVPPPQVPFDHASAEPCG